MAGAREPDGGVAVAVPVLVTPPPFTSACVVVYAAVHVSEARGASVVTPLQLTAERPGSGSVTLRLWRVTFPVLVTL
jgi:hypothetical protein